MQYLEGVDVSFWQGRSDWAAVAAAGVAYAYVRASNGSTIDARAADHLEAIARTEIIPGCYTFFHPSQPVGPQVDALASLVSTLPEMSLPPAIDVEITDGESTDAILGAIRDFRDGVIDKCSRRPVIYTGPNFWRRTLGLKAQAAKDMADLPLWLAHYTHGAADVPPPWKAWTFWQYTGSSPGFFGSVPGIVGAVDRNRFAGTVDDLRTFARSDRKSDTIPPGVCV